MECARRGRRGGREGQDVGFVVGVWYHRTVWNTYWRSRYVLILSARRGVLPPVQLGVPYLSGDDTRGPHGVICCPCERGLVESELRVGAQSEYDFDFLPPNEGITLGFSVCLKLVLLIPKVPRIRMNTKVLLVSCIAAAAAAFTQQQQKQILADQIPEMPSRD